jgi:hypothetical protein
VATSTADAVPPVLEFVVDITTSMTFTYAPSTHGASKWEATEQALSQAFASMPPNWAVGLMYFSKPSSSGCWSGQQAVPIAPLTAQQVTSINSSLVGVTPRGLTPTLAAWRFALNQLTSWTAPTEYAKSPRYIVLITDGVPTVNRDACTTGTGMNSCITQTEYDYFIQAITSETQASGGVKTFVIAVPGADDPQGATYDPLYQLSLFAAAGQTAPVGCTPSMGTVAPCYDSENARDSTCLATRGNYCCYDMTLAPDFVTALTATLATISTRVVSCSYEVPPPPSGFALVDPNAVIVQFTPSGGTPRDLTRAPGDSCAAGGQWYYSEFDATGAPTRLDFCPNTCDTAKNDPNATVQIQFTCLAQL